MVQRCLSFVYVRVHLRLDTSRGASYARRFALAASRPNKDATLPMNKSHRIRTGLVLAGVLAVTVLPSILRAQTYAVRWTGATAEILGLSDDAESIGVSINSSGQIAGYAHTSPWPSAVRWTGATEEVISPLGVGATGLGINASGQIAGDSGGSAVRWTGTTAEVLGTLGGSSRGFGINDSGQVAGHSYIAGNAHAVRWTGTTPEDLGTLGFDTSYARGINASGQVVGWVQNNGSIEAHAVLWNGTTAMDLGAGRAFGINSSGQIVGQVEGQLDFPFIYTNGTIYDLNTLLLPGSGVTLLHVDGNGGGIINDLGQIAAFGHVEGEHGGLRGLRLDPVPNANAYSVELLDLPDGWAAAVALGINESGQVAGYALVPEPSSAILMLGSGWICLLTGRRGRSLS